MMPLFFILTSWSSNVNFLQMGVWFLIVGLVLIVIYLSMGKIRSWQYKNEWGGDYLMCAQRAKIWSKITYRDSGTLVLGPEGPTLSIDLDNLTYPSHLLTDAHKWPCPSGTWPHRRFAVCDVAPAAPNQGDKGPHNSGPGTWIPGSQ